MKQRIGRLFAAALLLSLASSAFAQGNGLSGINEATKMVTSYFDPGRNLFTPLVPSSD